MGRLKNLKDPGPSPRPMHLQVIGYPDGNTPPDGRTPAMRNLNFDLIEEEILSEDSSRWTVRAMAEKFGVNIYTLSRFMNLPAYKERTRLLNQLKGHLWAEQGWNELQDRVSSNWEAKMAECRSNYCQFMAKVYNGEMYGNKTEVTVQTVLTPEDRERRLAELTAKLSLGAATAIAQTVLDDTAPSPDDTWGGAQDNHSSDEKDFEW